MRLKQRNRRPLRGSRDMGVSGMSDRLDGIAETYKDHDECLKLVCLELDKPFVFISPMLV